MDHVLCHVSARELPKQPPVDEAVWVESGFWSAIQKEIPIDVLQIAVAGNRPDPLTMPMRCVAAHPRLNHGDLAQQPVLYPLSSIGQLTVALMLQANLHDLLRFLSRLPACDRLGNIVRHGLFTIDILACLECCQHAACMLIE